MGQKVKAPRLHTCNILRLDAENQHVWQFGVSGMEVRPASDYRGPLDKPLPEGLATKDWQTLGQPKVNIAWLPADQVFLRVVQLPPSEKFQELVSMVELQLEKLSPLPVTQIVWSVEPLPAPAAGMQTLVVLIAARSFVEAFLGKLEGQGFLADRLELPLLHQLRAQPFEGEGLWICPTREPGVDLCLAAWWKEGVLQNLNLLRLSSGPAWSAILLDQLTQLAWAGEMEGWLTGIKRCVLVASPETAAVWEPALRQWLEIPIEITPPAAPAELAALNAQRLARNEVAANLLPPEYISRYRQQFVDRLWMRSLFAIGALYVAGVLIYFLALQILYYQKYRIESQVAALSGGYTNAMQLKARVQVLQDQVNLKYAALDCWKATAMLLPQDLALTDISFQQGKTLTIHGTAPADQVNQIIEYNQAMSRYRPGATNGLLLFNKVQPYNTSQRMVAGGSPTVAWDFACELNRKEVE